MVTIVLVHGAFADGSSWNRVIELLLHQCYRVFAADLATDTAAVLAATQRPIAAAAFDEMSGPPSWRSVKSWAIVATSDKAAGTDIVRQMAQRAGAKITEVDSSHVVMVSHPEV